MNDKCDSRERRHHQILNEFYIKVHVINHKGNSLKGLSSSKHLIDETTLVCVIGGYNIYLRVWCVR